MCAERFRDLDSDIEGGLLFRDCREYRREKPEHEARLAPFFGRIFCIEGAFDLVHLAADGDRL